MLSVIVGLLVGLVHAFEADHIAAVAQLTSKVRNIWQASLLGAWWGVGHTFSLVLVGVTVLVFKQSLPDGFFSVFEGVAAILVLFLSVSVLVELGVGKRRVAGRNAHKSILVGVFHGLAGSGAVLLALVAASESVVEGLLFLVLFGIGSVIGMAVASAVIGVPFALSSQKVQGWVRGIAGLFGVVVGCMMLYGMLI